MSVQPKQILCRAGVKKVKLRNTTKRRRNNEKSGLYAEQSITVKQQIIAYFLENRGQSKWVTDINPESQTRLDTAK